MSWGFPFSLSLSFCFLGLHWHHDGLHERAGGSLEGIITATRRDGRHYTRCAVCLGSIFYFSLRLWLFSAWLDYSVSTFAFLHYLDIAGWGIARAFGGWICWVVWQGTSFFFLVFFGLVSATAG